MIEYVKQKGVPIHNQSFLVMDCTDCIWYDALNSQWIIKHTKEEQINKSISYNVMGVAWNCENCNDPTVDNVKCANMMKGHTYDFEIGEDYVKCTNCPPSPKLCDYQILFSPSVEVVNDLKDKEPIALASYKNSLYLFYNRSGDIYYKTSVDGKSWNPEIKLTDSAREYLNPSAVVFKDDLYVAYSYIVNSGNWQIFLKKFDENGRVDVGQLTSIGWNPNSYLTTYKDKLYVFYQHSDGGSGIRYRICDDNCDVLANWGGEQTATDSILHWYPSAIEYDGKLHLTYSDNVNVMNDVYYKTCDDINNNNICDSNEWTSAVKITDSSVFYGKSQLIVYNNRLYIFYSKATSNVFYEDSRIVYRAYDGEWKNECVAAGGKIPYYADFSTATIHSGNLKLCYMTYDYLNLKIICK
jgi:hypothetical protein